MVGRFSPRGKKVFLWCCELGILALFLSLSLSACGITLFRSNCSGINIFCNKNGSTVISPNATAQAIAVATASVLQKHTPLVSDPLSGQDSNAWAVDDTCNFHNGAYFMTYSSSSNGTYTCDARTLHYSDAAIQMDVALLSGQSAGIMFRASAGMDEFYEFMVTEGQFSLGLFGNNNTSTSLIPFTHTSATHGAGAKNTLLVLSKGTDFRLFINGIFVGETHDATLTTGYVGMSLAYNPSGQASFSNLIIYPD